MFLYAMYDASYLDVSTKVWINFRLNASAFFGIKILQIHQISDAVQDLVVVEVLLVAATAQTEVAAKVNFKNKFDWTNIKLHS